MNFTRALEEANLKVEEGVSKRRAHEVAFPDNWLRFFPALSSDYQFCMTRMMDADGKPGVSKAEKAMQAQIKKSDAAWAELDNKAAKYKKGYSFDPVDFELIAANKRTDAPHCLNGSWDSIDSAADDYHRFFVGKNGQPLYEGKKDFETLRRTSDFITGMANALRSQGS